MVTGPTAVGKTAISLLLAKHYGVPIINADSRQLFAEIPIGTAAPTPEQLSMVPHYFVGTHHLTDYYSASLYERDVLSLLTPPGPLSGSEVALLSGGSMMYIDAVCDGIDDIPTVDDETRSVMKQRLESEGLERLAEELRLLDPEYFKTVDRRNTRRIVHALEICHSTGRPYSTFRVKQHKPRPFELLKIGLNIDRQRLYSRINARVDEMISQGFIEEALRVYPFRGANSLATVGYREMFEYLDGLCTLENAIERIKSSTRRYSRKQLTWLKRDQRIVWFDPSDHAKILEYTDSKILHRN